MPESPNQLPLAANLKVRTGAGATPGSTLTAGVLANPGAIGGLDAGVVNGYIDGDLVQKRPGVERVAPLLPCVRPRGMLNVSGHRDDYTLVVCDEMLLVDPEAGVKFGERWNQVSTGSVPWTNKNPDATHLVSFGGAILAIDGLAADVFSTTDGITWSTLTTAAGWAIRQNFGVVATPTFVYVIAGHSGATDRTDVWRSADAITWTQVYAGAAPTDGGLGAVGSRDPLCYASGETLYWGWGGTNADPTGGGGVTTWALARSADNGATWAAISVNALTFPLQSVFPAGLFCGGAVVTIPGASQPLGLFVLGRDPTAVWGMPIAATVGASAVIMKLVSRLPSAAAASVGWLNTIDGRVYWYQVAAARVFRITLDLDIQVGPSAPGTPVIPSVAVNLAGDCYSIAFNSTLGLNSEGMLLGMDATNGSNNVYSAVASRSPANGFYPNLFTTGFASDDILQYVSMDQYTPALVTSRTRDEPPMEGVFIKSRRDAYFFNTSNLVLSHVLDEDYPETTTDGVAILNGRVHVATPNGQIYSSEVNAPLDWRAVNFISAQAQPDKLVGIARRFGYIGAFGTQSIEWLQDIGAAQGTPLLPVDSAVSDYGCAHGHTIVRMNDTVLFVGRGPRTGDRSVFALNGYTPDKVSTPDIDRLIASYATDAVAAYPLYTGGHRLYVLDFAGTGTATTGGGGQGMGSLSLVYDLDTRAWYVWNSYLAQNLGAMSGAGVRTTDATGYTRVVITITAPATNNLVAAGDLIEIRGATPSAYNGEWIVDTAPGSTTFSILVATDPGAITVGGEVHLLRNVPLETTASAVSDFGNSLRFPISHSAFGLDFVGQGGDSASRALTYPANVGTTAADAVFPSMVQLSSGKLRDDWLGRPYAVITGTSEQNAQSHIECLQRTLRWDGGGNASKFIYHLDLIADILSSGAKAWLRHSDDDRRTYTSLLEVGLDTDRPRATRQGRTRRRVYDVRFTDTTRTGRFERLEALVSTDGVR